MSFNISKESFSGDFYSVDLSSDGTIGIAGSSSANGILYTNDSGANWIQSNVTTGSFYSVALSSNGTIGIAGGYSNNGIYYTNNSGPTAANWTQSNVTTGDFYSVALSSDGTIGIAGSSSENGIYYTNDSGANWTQSNVTTGNFYSVALSSDGTIGIVGSASNNGIYYTNDSGANWTQSNVTTGDFYSVALSSNGTIGIAGSASGNGIYYTNSIICYEENVEILCYENDSEIFKKISKLKIGDTVKTYKDGYKNIKYLKQFKYTHIQKYETDYLYKYKNTDIIITGGHSILVDELTEEESINNLKYMFSSTIHDKKLLLACASDKFEKITDKKDYILYHLVLENENSKGHYGVYLKNDILSESCSEAAFLEFFNLPDIRQPDIRQPDIRQPDIRQPSSVILSHSIHPTNVADMPAQSSPFVKLQAGGIIIENGRIICLNMPSSGVKVVLQSGHKLPKTNVTISNSIITIPAGTIVFLQNGTPICLQFAANGFQVVSSSPF
jgi:hypothetical protein